MGATNIEQFQYRVRPQNICGLNNFLVGLSFGQRPMTTGQAVGGGRREEGGGVGRRAMGVGRKAVG